MAEWARGNGAEAAKHYYNAVPGLRFRGQVQNKGPWEYKQYHPQDFGNYNDGYTGKAAGIAPNILLQQAGRAQIAAAHRNLAGVNQGVRWFFEAAARLLTAMIPAIGK